MSPNYGRPRESSDTDEKEISRQSLLERQFLLVSLRAIYLAQQAEELSSTGGARLEQVIAPIYIHDSAALSTVCMQDGLET